MGVFLYAAQVLAALGDKGVLRLASTQRRKQKHPGPIRPWGADMGEIWDGFGYADPKRVQRQLGLAWLGLAWLGLAWLGLAWLGLVLCPAIIRAAHGMGSAGKAVSAEAFMGRNMGAFIPYLYAASSKPDSRRQSAVTLPPTPGGHG